jgi:hypothetical protein
MQKLIMCATASALWALAAVQSPMAFSALAPAGLKSTTVKSGLFNLDDAEAASRRQRLLLKLFGTTMNWHRRLASNQDLPIHIERASPLHHDRR